MMGWREADDAAARARFTPDAAVQISHSVKNSHHTRVTFTFARVQLCTNQKAICKSKADLASSSR